MSKHNAQTAAKDGARFASEDPETKKQELQDGPLAGADQSAESLEGGAMGGDTDLAAKDAEIEAYRKRIVEVEAELSAIKEQYLRKAAESENFRKRMAREKQEAIDFANQSLLLDLIPVIDDFERAIKSAEGSKNFESFHEGIVLIEKRLVSQLESKWQLVRFESNGKPFDPNFHEAIMMEKSADVSEPMVAEDFYKGYTLKDRVIRSAKVRVIMPDEQAAVSEPAAAPESKPDGAEKADEPQPGEGQR